MLMSLNWPGIEKIQCDTIDCARVAGAPAALECRVTQIVQIEGPANFVTIGEVIGVHLRDDCLVDGMFDVTKFQPLARLGYRDYASVSEVFSLKRPENSAVEQMLRRCVTFRLVFDSERIFPWPVPTCATSASRRLIC